VLDDSGNGYFSDVIAALEWCVANGIHITNNSYSSSGDPGTIVRDAFRETSSAGILHVAAAGNSGNRFGLGDRIGYPAKYPTVIAVGAVNRSDSRASFSSHGPTLELVAPGVSIYSTIPGNGYASYSGTSMACPHVAGAAALLMEAGVEHGLTTEEVRQTLIMTARDLGASGRDNLYGYGLIDAVMAVEFVGPPSPPQQDPEEDPEEDPEPEPEPVIPVASVDSIAFNYSGGFWIFRGNLDITIQLVDDQGQPLSGASVQAEILRNGSRSATRNGTTNASGAVNFRVSRASAGEWSVRILNVNAPGHEWDGVTPSNSYIVD
jgi:subtilisin